MKTTRSCCRHCLLHRLKNLRCQFLAGLGGRDCCCLCSFLLALILPFLTRLLTCTISPPGICHPFSSQSCTLMLVNSRRISPRTHVVIVQYCAPLLSPSATDSDLLIDLQLIVTCVCPQRCLAHARTSRLTCTSYMFFIGSLP